MTAPTPVDEAPRRPRRRSRWPSVADLIGFVFALIGFCLGIRSIGDNSLFTHIATGRLILERGSIPTTDPYSFTAPDAPWVVQSWLADLAYGVAERVAGGNGIRVLGGVLVGAVLAGVWRLTAPARSLVGRIAIEAMVVLIGVAFFAPRPLVFGLVLLTVTLVIITEDRDPRWLIAVMWLWVNLHGSFPLALVAIGCVALGRRLDGDRTSVPWRPLLWASVGVLLGAVNPLGPKLLLFPVDLLGRMEILQNVIEWQSPNFSTSYARLFLVQVVVAVLVLVRRPSYRAAVPLVVFVAAALLGTRNIPIASIVMVPGLALGLADKGRLADGRERGPATVVVGVVAVLVAGAVAASSLSRPAFDLETYPVGAVGWLEERGLLTADRRIATTDSTGNFLELQHGTAVRTFFDDRYDMYPTEVSLDYVTLNSGGERWQEVLDRHEIEYLVWPTGTPLASLVRQSPAWSVVYEDDDEDVLIACRRGRADGC